MTTPTSRIERTAGVIIFLAALVWAGAVVVRGLAHDWFTRRPTVTFSLGEAHGLTEGARVVMNGVPIGSVRTIRLNQENVVSVILEILPEHASRLTDGLSARVKPPALFGSAEVSLIPGLERERLAHGARIPAEVATNTTQSFQEVAERAQGLVENLESITGRLDEGEGSIGRLLSDDGEFYASVEALIDEMRATMTEVRGLKGEISAGITEARQLVSSIRAKLDPLEELLDRSTSVVKRLNEVAATIAEREEGLPALLADMRLTLAEARGILQDLSADLPGLVDSARRATSESRRLIRAGQRNILVRPYLEPLSPFETSIAGSRRWDPYDEE